MRFETSPATLARGLAALNGVAEFKNTIPILSNVHISGRAGDNSVTVRVTDMDIESSALIEAKVHDGGEITVPYRGLSRIAAAFRGAGTIEAAALTPNPGTWPNPLSDYRMNLRASLAGLDLGLDDGEFSAQLRTLPPEEFPRFREIGDEVARIQEPASRWLAILRPTVPFISTEAQRYYLNGVFLVTVIRPGGAPAPDIRWAFVATDGHRLARSVVRPAENAVPAPSAFTSVIIPRSAVMHMVARLQACPPSEVMTLTVHKSGQGAECVRAVFSDGAGEMLARCIDGTFPDYERVIPTGDYGHRVSVNVGRLGKVVKAAVASADMTKPNAAISLDAKCVMTFTLSDQDGGRLGRLPLPISWGHQPLEVGVQLRYLSDCLDLLAPGASSVLIQDASSPIRMDVEDPADGIERTAVLMPMRV